MVSGALHLQCYGLPCKRLDKYLHTTPQTQHQVQGRFLLNIVISKSTTILKLLPSEDEPLLIRGDALLVLDLCLHIVNSIRALHFKGDGFPCEGLHKNLHSTPQTQHQVKGRLLLNVVIS
ncbi:hypothetical protein Syun_010217 [Stephania yunnanensis]|uniref:Uncharacterized protein n=1 Tax=Stephania yunnanensis TaxID=152371 RepID=A0AAP0KHP5_9MAGN